MSRTPYINVDTLLKLNKEYDMTIKHLFKKIELKDKMLEQKDKMIRKLDRQLTKMERENKKLTKEVKKYELQ